MQSKKHRDAVFKEVSKIKVEPSKAQAATDEIVQEELAEAETSAAAERGDELPAHFESSGDPKLDLVIARRLQAAPPVKSTTCLFCPHASLSPRENLAHMRLAHSFVVPDEEYLVDLDGLLSRLGEEVGTWNVCIYCGKGYGGNIKLDEDTGPQPQSNDEMKKKASKGLESVRRHMLDKSHCKIRYDTEDERLDLSDFYDFRPSYADYKPKKQRRYTDKAGAAITEGQDGWEDMDEDGDVAMDEDGEVVYEMDEGASDEESDDDDDSDEELPESQITYGDSVYQLVLPSGARIGHRQMRRVYKRNEGGYADGRVPFRARVRDGTAEHNQKQQQEPSEHQKSLLRLVPAEANQALVAGGKGKTHAQHAASLRDAGLVPAKGAGWGSNSEMVKAPNKGEAKQAGRLFPKVDKVAYLPPKAGSGVQKGG